jgi:hypothetical protein
LITHSKEQADSIAEKTWKVKHEEQERIQLEIQASQVKSEFFLFY